MRLSRVLIAFGAAAALALSACATGLPSAASPEPAADPPASSGVLSITTADEKALYAAEAAYFGVAKAAEVAVDAGLLRGAPAAQVASLLERGYASLGVARSAYRAGNARSVRSAISEALDAFGSAQRILRPTPG